MSRQYSISMVSLFPLSWGPGGLAYAARYVQERGMYLQALPLAGIRIGAPKDTRILSIEGAWHPDSGDFFGAVRRFFQPSKDQFPTLLDFLLFGSGHRTNLDWLVKNNPRAILVEHEPSKEWLEIHPELRKFKPRGQTMLQWLTSRGNPVVLDTYHVRRLGGHGEPPVFGDNWVASIHRLAMYGMVGMIHFQPKRGTNELSAFMCGQPTALEELLVALRPTSEDVPVVLELSPLSRFRHDFLDVRDRISAILD